MLNNVRIKRSRVLLAGVLTLVTTYSLFILGITEHGEQDKHESELSVEHREVVEVEEDREDTEDTEDTEELYFELDARGYVIIEDKEVEGQFEEGKIWKFESEPELIRVWTGEYNTNLKEGVINELY